MSDILLATINARYQHASLGLRCLLANLGELAPRAGLLEFVSGARTEDLVERILARRPRIVGLGVYIWNVDECTRLAAQLRCVAPEITLVVGGPEVSHETDDQAICALADHVVTGAGEHVFAGLCRQLLAGGASSPKLLHGGAPAPDSLALPYALYDDEDLRKRFIYLEASRGCPFKCEFCLSALDRTAVPFPLPAILDALADLYERGARRFKFVDRTFNLKVASSLAILDFFLDRLERAPDDPVFAHFELVPDHLPDRLRDAIRRFPAGTLQLEIGIQTWNPEVQARISRRQDNDKAAENLHWLGSQTDAHTHVDLIAGLPGEDLDSFGAGFDRLVALGPHEIQVGILKRLRGAPIARHTEAFGLRFNPAPPYNVLATGSIGFADMQRVTRFARYWDLIGNSGRFRRTLPLVLGNTPFARFIALSDWIHSRTGATSHLSAERQFELVREWLLGPGGNGLDERGSDGFPAAGQAATAFPGDKISDAIEQAILADYAGSGARGRPAFLARGIAAKGAAAAASVPAAGAAPKRQARHLA